MWSPARDAINAGQYMYRRISQASSVGTSKSLSLMEAVCVGDLGSIHKAVAAGESLYQRDEDGHTLLHHAAKFGQAESIIFLLNQGLNVNETCEGEQTPLHYASKYGQAAAAEALGAFESIDMDAENESNWTPLHIACEKGHADVIRTLCKYNANVNAPIEGTKWTPILLAITTDNANEDAVRALLKAGADKSMPGCFIVADEFRDLLEEEDEPPSSLRKSRLSRHSQLSRTSRHSQSGMDSMTISL